MGSTQEEESMDITVITKVTPKRLSDIMCGAIECNWMTRTWCEGVYLAGALKDREEEFEIKSEHSDSVLPWYCNPALYERDDFEIDVVEFDYDDDEGPDKHHLVTKADLTAGLQLMAEKQTHHFSDIIEEKDDAITADCFLQMIALKEYVYG